MTDAFRSTHDVVLRTERWAEAVAFYRTALRLPVILEEDGFIGFDTGAFKLYVERGPAHGPIFEFLVPDLAAAQARLLAAGCTVFEDDPSVPHLYMRDPFGFTFNIAQTPNPGD